MKIVLLGKTGMLGSEFDQQLADHGVEVFSFDRTDLDVTSSRSLKGIFKAILPDIVINCTAYTNVDEAEFQKDAAFELNRDVPLSLAQLCNKCSAILIHFSTDYIFDGKKVPPDGYKEDDIANPLGVYGESKFQGEEAVRNEMAKYFIIRTSWLYGTRPTGTKGGNFVNTMLRLGKEVLSGEREKLNVVGDQFGSPTYTTDLAGAVIEQFIMKFPKNMPGFGVYHLSNSEFCSWHEFAVRIFKIAGMKVDVGKITTAEYRTAAQRPKNSILLNTKLSGLRKWDDALVEYLYKITT